MTIDTIDGLEEEHVHGDPLSDDIIDLIESENGIAGTMARATLAMDAVLQIVIEAALAPGERHPVVDAILDVVENHCLTTIRKPMPDEIADPDWWGHAAGVTSDTMMHIHDNDFMHTSASIYDVMTADEEAQLNFPT